MCLVKMKVEHEEDETPSAPRRIIVRPVSQHGSDRIIVAHTSSRPVSRVPSQRSSQRSSRIITVLDPAPTLPRAPRPAQYVLSPSSLSAPSSPNPRHSIPRIIHAAPSPPRSPRVSHTSVHSSRSRHNSVSGGSPRGSRTRVVSEGEIVYVSTERERGSELRRLSTRGERPRSGQFLTTAAAAMAATDNYTYVEPSREDLYIEDRDGGRARRSITYATTGPRLSRERVLIDEGGRRRESYQVVGSR